ncbi:hypothetical protein K1719_018077 [Acacia pycnantha]|nr:hypothetical protein K1719_018077 [Acacia pycnantha]
MTSISQEPLERFAQFRSYRDRFRLVLENEASVNHEAKIASSITIKGILSLLMQSVDGNGGDKKLSFIHFNLRISMAMLPPLVFSKREAPLSFGIRARSSLKSLTSQEGITMDAKFKVFVMASEYGLWRVFEIGNYSLTIMENGLRVPKPEEDYDENDRRNLAALGKTYKQPVQVRKILNILNKEWEAKVTAIEEACGESMSSVAALFGSLSEYEGKIKFRKRLDEMNSKSKGIALKAAKEAKESDNDEEEDEDEELGLMV